MSVFKFESREDQYRKYLVDMIEQCDKELNHCIESNASPLIARRWRTRKSTYSNALDAFDIIYKKTEP